MADSLFEEPRLAGLYDLLEAKRLDLDAYVDLASQLGARSMVDVGCGTGTLACMLAQRGMAVTGLDRAAASLDVAKSKCGGEQVRWVLGDATSLPPLQTDLVTMTGNVAQVFLTDEHWASVLSAANACTRGGGHLVFEVRDPEREAWRKWTRDQTHRHVELPDGGVETWVDLTDLRLPLVSFQQTFAFDDGTVLASGSTLRFRCSEEIIDSLTSANFIVEEVRDAPDRPGMELVFLARRRD